MPWCGLEKLGVELVQVECTRKGFGPAKSSACAKEEAYRVSGDLKSKLFQSAMWCGQAKNTLRCKVAMILRTAKYIASLALLLLHSVFL